MYLFLRLACLNQWNSGQGSKLAKPLFLFPVHLQLQTAQSTVKCGISLPIYFSKDISGCKRQQNLFSARLCRIVNSCNNSSKSKNLSTEQLQIPSFRTPARAWCIQHIFFPSWLDASNQSTSNSLLCNPSSFASRCAGRVVLVSLNRPSLRNQFSSPYFLYPESWS